MLTAAEQYWYWPWLPLRAQQRLTFIVDIHAPSHKSWVSRFSFRSVRSMLVLWLVSFIEQLSSARRARPHTTALNYLICHLIHSQIAQELHGNPRKATQRGTLSETNWPVAGWLGATPQRTVSASLSPLRLRRSSSKMWIYSLPQGSSADALAETKLIRGR